MIKLFLNDIQVDWSEDFSILMTYQTEDLNNPTIVKNAYSKTISIPGTKKNNSIFGNYYQLDRYVINHSGNTTIGVEYNPSKRIPFKIYNDANLVESGYAQLDSISLNENEITYNITLYGGLGDFFYELAYKETGEKLTLADLTYKPDAGLDFQITKEYIKDCFEQPLKANRLITFFPALNGVPDNFDSSAALINPKDQTIFSGDTYGLAKLNKSYTEWQARDLRSYKQRPALRLKELITTILDNSGYDYILDNSFFNDSNPYWFDSFIALPLLDSSNEDNLNEDIKLDKLSGNWEINEQINPAEGLLKVSQNEQVSQDGDYIDLSTISDSASLNVDVDSQFIFSRDNIIDAEELVLEQYSTEGTDFSYLKVKNTLYAKLLAVDDYGNTIAESNEYSFSEGYSFKKVDFDYYLVEENSGNNTFRLSLKTSKKANKVKLILKIYFKTLKEGKENYAQPTLFLREIDSPAYSGVINISFNAFLSIKQPSDIGSGSYITKEDILKTDHSPADYLLSIGKLFGWYYIKDPVDKKITILTRENFYKRKVIRPKIDYSKEFTINPILFDKKWYKLSLEQPDNYFSKKYKKQYNLTYGQKRLDTGYNFNKETSDLYSENIFQGSIPIRDSDRFYRTFKTKSGEIIPPYLMDNLTYNDQEMYGSNYLYQTVEWNTGLRGQDSQFKSCFYNLDSDSKSLEEIEQCLLFYNGQKALKEDFWLTDDLPEMIDLNESPCWLWTRSEFNNAGDRIAYKLSYLPEFISYYIDNGNITKSFDFGVPREIYIDNVVYPETSTLYNQFWDKFYKDQFNVNTKKVTCYILADNLNQESLRYFYWFNNSYWILNKIDSLDIANKNNTVRCEFIKVQNINNYAAGNS